MEVALLICYLSVFETSDELMGVVFFKTSPPVQQIMCGLVPHGSHTQSRTSLPLSYPPPCTSLFCVYARPGCLMSAMFNADADQLIKYIFPVERLPAHTQVCGLVRLLADASTEGQAIGLTGAPYCMYI
jgi:hypothetical protein